MKIEQSVPKRRHIKFRRRGIAQKKAYNIQNTAKVWNEKYFSSMGRKLQLFYNYLPMKIEQVECSETSAYKIQTPGNYPEEKYNIHNTAKDWNQEYFSFMGRKLQSFYNYLPMKMEQSVLKRRHIKFRCRGITQKKTYNIQNTMKV